MIAIPIADAHATSLFPRLGDASFFAALDPADGYFNIIKGPDGGGLEARIRLLKEKGIDAAVIPDAATETLDAFSKEGIPVYAVPGNITSIDDVFEAYQRRELPLAE